MLNSEELNAIMALMARIDLKGAEVPAYSHLMNRLSEEHSVALGREAGDPDGEPADPPGVA